MALPQAQNIEDLPQGSIPSLTLQEGVTKESIDAVSVANVWLSRLASRFNNKNFQNLSELFIEDSWWKDYVGLAWDYTTKHGVEEISKYLTTSPNLFTEMAVISSGALQPALVDMGGMIYIQFGFTFSHIHGKGTAVVKLAHVTKEEWKAWIVFTQLEALHAPKESKGETEQSFDATKLQSGKYDVVVVGAGQSGLALGTHLKSLGLRAIIVGKEAQLGDSWRARYESFKVHTPKYTDHYPFMKYPDNLPTWLARDDIADFMPGYAKFMNLNILLNTEVTNIKYNTQQKAYEVQAQTPQGTLTFHPRHVVLATGAFSSLPSIPQIPKMDSFNGHLYHSLNHQSANEISDLANKKVVIIGAGTSAHDLAQDFVTAGAKEISLIQRGAIFSISRESLGTLIFSLWNTPGVSTAEADLMGNSIPVPILRTMNVGMTQMMSVIDKDMLAGLRKAGLVVKDGSDGSGLIDHQLIKGGHFYIDQGANEMIIDGRIKIHQCDGGIREFTNGGIVLANGVELDADVIVLATGFYQSNMNAAHFLGEEVVEKMDHFGFLDDEQERGGWWRPTGVPGFWYMTGSFMWSRQFSLLLALQIAAIVRGVNESYYDTQTLLE